MTPEQLTDTPRDEVRARIKLSQTLRRNAHYYERSALEYHAKGHMDRFAEYRAKANRAWDDAKWFLATAKDLR